jgi:hypothetical protein
LGIEIDAGLASFPHDEVTMRGLLDRAETTMRLSRHGMTVHEEVIAYPVAAV